MSNIPSIPSALSGTALAQSISAVHRIYKDADTATESWRQKSGFTCETGCGTCCERFVPDLLRIEADCIALFLLTDNPELKNLPSDPYRNFCSFFDPHNPEHCRIYPVRPLVCRLFGFSSTLEKSGKPVLSLCKFMKHPHPHTHSFTRQEPGTFFTMNAPAMSDYSFRLYSLETSLTGRTTPIHEATAASLEKLRYILSRNTPDDTSPDGAGPVIKSA